MIRGKTAAQNDEVNLSAWQAYIEQLCGFVLPLAQHHWLSHAILKTATTYNLTSQELYQILISDAQQGQIIKPATQSLLDNMLIAESRFFRHEPSVDFIGSLYKATSSKINKQHNNDFLVWSIGCSTGQEVYSIAMALKLIRRQLNIPSSFTITGSDLSAHSLQIAVEGIYDNRQIEQIPKKYHSQLFLVATDGKSPSKASSNQTYWQIGDDICKHTHFFWHNAFSKTPVNLPKQDVIICQNMLIYFRKFDQRDILAYFVQHLTVGGYLLLAPNEAMLWQHPSMKRVESNQINAWQKITD